MKIHVSAQEGKYHNKESTQEGVGEGGRNDPNIVWTFE
jgi:hypothetical protein